MSIVVADTGKGISSEFLPRIFERFRQADSGTTRSHGGLGIGLAIARYLIELHGGRLRADSAGEGRGATFTVTLPRLTPEPDVVRPGTALASAVPASLANGLRLDGLRVLLVEDEEDTRECLTLALAERGAEVTAVSSAADALAAVDRATPDVVVSDVGMAREDGYTLIRELRAREAGGGERVPAAALTAYVRPEDRARALLAGFDAHVEKPVGPAELATVVKSLAQRAGRT